MMQLYSQRMLQQTFMRSTQRKWIGQKLQCSVRCNRKDVRVLGAFQANNQQEKEEHEYFNEQQTKQEKCNADK